MADRKTKKIPPKEIRTEEGAQELLSSPVMQLYVECTMAGMLDKDIGPHIERIRELPLERRYVWRVASAMKWAFADFDTVTVNLDRETLSEDDMKKLIDLIRHRPLQFCLFLKALFGPAAMKRLMVSAIKQAEEIDG